MWRLCCAGLVSHEGETDPLQYGSNGNTKKGIEGPGTTPTTVTYKRRNSNSVDETLPAENADSITSSEPCSDGPAPNVSVTPPAVVDTPSPKPVTPNTKSVDKGEISGIVPGTTQTVTYKRKNSDSSVDDTLLQADKASITSSEPCPDGPVPIVSVTEPPATDNTPSPKPPKHKTKPTDDNMSLSSYKPLTPNKTLTLLDLAQGRYSDLSDEDSSDNKESTLAKGEQYDSVDDLDSSKSKRKKGPLSSLFGGSKDSILSVYSEAEGNYGKIPITGEVLFGITYDQEQGVLDIDIQECKDLAPVDTKNNRSDPYIKTYLLPDKTRSGKKKTKIKKHTLNPVFDEVIKYTVPEGDISNRTLWLTVWNNDKFGRNDFLGEVLVPFESYDLTETSMKWYTLQERLPGETEDEEVVYKGDLIFSIMSITPENLDNESSKKSKKKKGSNRGELHVMIKEARNLTALHSNGTSNPFCKGYLLPDKNKTSKQKTTVVKKNCSPVWDQVFIFQDVSLEDLPDRSLELSVWDHETLSSNDFLGGNRFNLGIGTSEGKEVDWMDSRGEEIVTWQNVIDNPNTWIDVTIGLRASMGQNKINK